MSMIQAIIYYNTVLGVLKFPRRHNEVYEKTDESAEWTNVEVGRWQFRALYLSTLYNYMRESTEIW